MLYAKGEEMLLHANVSQIILVIPMLPAALNVPQMRSVPQTKRAKDYTVLTHVQTLDVVLTPSAK